MMGNAAWSYAKYSSQKQLLCPLCCPQNTKTNHRQRTSLQQCFFFLSEAEDKNLQILYTICPTISYCFYNAKIYFYLINQQQKV